MTLGRPFCFSGSGGFSKLRMRRSYSRQGEILKLKRASSPLQMCADKLAEDGDVESLHVFAQVAAFCEAIIDSESTSRTESSMGNAAGSRNKVVPGSSADFPEFWLEPASDPGKAENRVADRLPAVRPGLQEARCLAETLACLKSNPAHCHPPYCLRRD
jgi:hypothetical protein